MRVTSFREENQGVIAQFKERRSQEEGPKKSARGGGKKCWDKRYETELRQEGETVIRNGKGDSSSPVKPEHLS